MKERNSYTITWKYLLWVITGGGRLFDVKVSMCFCEPIISRKKSKGKMLNMLLLIREMFYYFKK